MTSFEVISNGVKWNQMETNGEIKVAKRRQMEASEVFADQLQLPLLHLLLW